METSFGSRLVHAWNSLFSRDPTIIYRDVGSGYYRRPDRPRLTHTNAKTIITAIQNRIALDAAQIEIRHVILDEDGRYEKDKPNSGINECLNVSANIDQSGRAFRHDIYLSMLDEGSVAIAATKTDVDPTKHSSYKMLSMRTGKVTQWYPQHVKLYAYNEQKGEREETPPVPKNSLAIVENPFFAVMNEPNSIMQRLARKLALLDAIDEQSGSGKLDLIIQLPYVIKSDARRQQAEQRRKDIEDQLAGSQYGIAYTDGTERITQLNRPVENNLMKQIEYLTSMLYSQLGITQSIMDGTADEKTMLNYYNRTIEPLVSAVVDEMKRKFLTPTARAQGQSILFFRDMFKLTPVLEMAEVVDKFTRNEIATTNEMRQMLGWKPSKDPKADELRNKNLSEPAADKSAPPPNGAVVEENKSPSPKSKEEIQNG